MNGMLEFESTFFMIAPAFADAPCNRVREERDLPVLKHYAASHAAS
jgi:hypothetical protein